MDVRGLLSSCQLVGLNHSSFERRLTPYRRRPRYRQGATEGHRRSIDEVHRRRRVGLEIVLVGGHVQGRPRAPRDGGDVLVGQSREHARRVELPRFFDDARG
jgi:hypothetical protein